LNSVLFSVSKGFIAEDERLLTSLELLYDAGTLFSWVLLIYWILLESFDNFLRRGGFLLFTKIDSLGVLPVIETGFSVLLRSNVLDNSFT